MPIHLPLAVEAALLQEAAATGVTPGQLVVDLYQRHQRESIQRDHHPFIETSAASSQIESRRLAVARIRALRDQIGSTFGPAVGQGLREWMHEGHLY